MILVKENILAYKTSIEKFIENKNITIIKIINNTKKHIFAISLYLPPKGNENRKKTLNDFEEVLQFLSTSYKDFSLIAFADLNSNMRNTGKIDKQDERCRSIL